MNVRARILELLVASNVSQKRFAELLGISYPTLAKDLDRRQPMSDRIRLYKRVVDVLTEKPIAVIGARRQRGAEPGYGVPERVRRDIERGTEIVPAVRYAQYRAGLATVRKGRPSERVFERLERFSLQGPRGKRVAEAMLTATYDSKRDEGLVNVFRFTSSHRAGRRRVLATGDDPVSNLEVREALGVYWRRLSEIADGAFSRALAGTDVHAGFVPFRDLGARSFTGMTPEQRIAQRRLVAGRRKIEKQRLRNVRSIYDAIRYAGNSLSRSDRKRTNARLSKAEESLLSLAVTGDIRAAVAFMKPRA